MPTVREAMDADPVTVRPDTDVETLVRTLHRHELQGVPVVDEDVPCVGSVTESDLVIADEQGDLHLPPYIHLFGRVVSLEPLRGCEALLGKASASSAADMMSAKPTTVSPDTDVHEAARIIAKSGHNRLPVVDGDGRLVGVVTRVDVLEALTA